MSDPKGLEAAAKGVLAFLDEHEPRICLEHQDGRSGICITCAGIYERERLRTALAARGGVEQAEREAIAAALADVIRSPYLRDEELEGILMALKIIRGRVQCGDFVGGKP